MRDNLVTVTAEAVELHLSGTNAKLVIEALIACTQDVLATPGIKEPEAMALVKEHLAKVGIVLEVGAGVESWQVAYAIVFALQHGINEMKDTSGRVC